MKNGELSKLMSVSGRILLAFLFVFSQIAWAGQDSKPKDKPKPAQNAAVQQTGEKISPTATTAKTETEQSQTETSEKSAAEEKPSGDGKHEGIRVHGHWTIEVHNPDGTLVTHQEFENSLQQGSGPIALTGILGHLYTSGYWIVGLNTSPACGFDNRGTPSGCLIFETSSGVNYGVAFAASTLVATVTNGGANLTLQGNIQPIVALQITAVQTSVELCPPSTSSQACATSAASPIRVLTSTSLATPVAVQANQFVQVTVVISFS